MYQISENIIYVKGIKNGAIYNFNSGDVFSINNIACLIIDKLIHGQSLDKEELKYKCLLEENNLFDSLYKINKYAPENTKVNKLNLVWLEITQACNMKCIHCYEGNQHIVSENPLNLLKWKEVIDQIAELSVDRVVVIGGEPCMHNDVQEILEYLALKGIRTTLFTNASLLNEKLKKIIIDKNIEVKVSLYGHNSEIHDSITKVKGSFSTLIENIRYFVEYNISVSIAVVIMKENENYYNEIEEFVKSLNISKYKTDVIREVFLGKQHMHSPQNEKIVNLAKRTVPNFNISKNKFNEALFKNTCWSGKIVVSEDGNVLPCVFARNISYGNVQNNTIKQILTSELLQKYWNMDFSKIEICKDCEYRFACKDCRPLAMSYNGAINNKNPRCNYNPYKGEWNDEFGK